MKIKKKGTNPEYINEFSTALLDGFYLQDGETFDDALARSAEAFCFGDYDLAQRIYEAAWNGWFMFASPILSNAPKGEWNTKNGRLGMRDEDLWKFLSSHTLEQKKDPNFNLTTSFVGDDPRSMPISCFSMYIPDTIDGQMDANKELAALSVAGGGVGLHNGIRATSDKAPGPIPYMKTMDGLIGYYQQSKNRRGACAYYMDISHPDIIEHIRFRVPSGGDSARKSDNRKQFHSAVNVTDEFIQAVLADEMFNLVDPHSNEVREVIRARDIWEELLEVRALTGEPYIFKIDTANRALPQTQKDKGLKINGSNICVTPETPILTDKGHLPIGALDGLTVNVWNGEEFTETTVHKTGDLEHVIRVNTSKGHFIDCTPMHSFYVVRSYGKNAELVKAHELQPGDKLEKCDMPVIEGERTLFRAYTNGFYTGDGCEVKGRSRIYLYDQKQALAEDIEGVESWTVQEDFNRMYGYAEGLQEKYFIPDATYTIASRVKWLAGLMDSDGTLLKTGKSQSETVQIGSANLPFLQDVQLMLQTLGVDANISLMRERGSWLLPANDWTGELKEFDCEEVNRLLISSYDLYRLSKLGLSCNRLQISGRKPQREAKVFNAIVSVEDYSRVSDVYCFTESGRNKGIFGGILTGQCIEITLPTSEDRTFVCCLSSLNLEKYDEWADTTLVADLVRYLDNVIQFFIEKAPDSLEKAKISAAKERAIGIGTMGWHHYLQSKGIPFEGGGFGSGIQETHKIFSHIKAQAVAESEKLAIERGEPEDMVGSGRRNSHLFAIAPNSNNSVILGTSPSIEPVSGNTYSQSTRAGTFTVKNPYLDKLLYSIALGLDGIFEPDEWVTEQWRDIIAHDGSVQHLEYLSIEEKEVFKTAFEIDQHWLIEQADARQQYVCQSQSLNLFFPSGVSRTYYNSVHLKALTSEYVKSLYYSRMERGINADVVKEIERKVIEDWAGDDCVACSG